MPISPTRSCTIGSLRVSRSSSSRRVNKWWSAPLAREQVDDAPRLSLELSALVLGVLEATGDEERGYFRSLVHACAWQGQGDALFQAGQSVGALRAYRKAGDLSIETAQGPLGLAAAKCGEAMVCHRVGDSDEALVLLRNAAKVFQERSDAGCVAQCLLDEGIVHFENDRFEAARASYERALLQAGRSGDPRTIAWLHVSLADCAIARGERETALRELARALEGGLLAVGRRVALAMARLLIAGDRIDRGIEALEEVAAIFAARGLVVDAALARRDIVEVLVLDGRLAQAALVARGVLETLGKAGMFRDAMRTIALQQHANSGVAVGGWGDDA